MKQSFKKYPLFHLLQGILIYHIMWLTCISIASLMITVLPFEIYINYQTYQRPDTIFNKASLFDGFVETLYYMIFLCLISSAVMFDLIKQSGTYLLLLMPALISIYLILFSKKKSFWVNWKSVMLIHTIIVICYLAIMYQVEEAPLIIYLLLFSCFTIAISISAVWLIKYLERIEFKDNIK